jgi:exonuclease SbcC
VIKAISIQNFQSHRNTHIDFAPGVNALVGLSDNGKTVVLRALAWVINNRPLGDGFRSYWGGDTVVAVELGDGRTVERGRSKSDNWYKIDDPEDPSTGERIFRAFGQEPPAEVTALFNMNEINASAQMDAPFLLSSAPGEVAQILNRVVNLDCIDAAVSAIRKKKLQADTELKTSEALLQNLTIKIEDLNWLGHAEEAVSQAEALQQQADAIQVKRTSLSFLCGKIAQISKDTRPLAALIAADKGLAYVDELQRRKSDILQKRNKLSGLVAQGQQSSATVTRTKGWLPAGAEVLVAESTLARVAAARKQHTRLLFILNAIDSEKVRSASAKLLAGAFSNVVLANVAHDKVQRLRDRASALDALLEKIDKRQAQAEQLSTALKTLDAQYHDLMPDVCPLCGRS